MAGDELPYDVERIKVGDDITWSYPQRGVVTAIGDTVDGVRMVSGTMLTGPNRGQSASFQMPATKAGQAATGLTVTVNVPALPYRSWWRAADGSEWYVRGDGQLYCDKPGAVFKTGAIRPRATLDDLEPVTP